MKKDKVTALRDALCTAAIDVQSLAHQLAASDTTVCAGQAAAVKAAAGTLADTARALNHGRDTHELALFFGSKGHRLGDDDEDDFEDEPVEDEAAPATTRGRALARGLPRYFTGQRCVHGHVAERMTKNGNCVICQKLRQAP
ncbi:hypothetical protein [Diaphorobacter sp.]|uniref:hypothetical protein n=1 Tax=Diaphorobacter sp. TaxID=1934310 RepID=UPI002587B471|nr:hypothetical protein [Diaphorobacter sp.]